MAPIGSVIKNTLVYSVIMIITVFVAVYLYLFGALVNLIRYVESEDATLHGSPALTDLLLGTIILFVGFGLALNLTLPSIVGDEMIEF